MAGSTRADSLNRRLANLAARELEAKGATVTQLDLAEYPLPVYNQDIETDEGIPTEALALHEQMSSHDGIFIASPEYNSAIPPLLVNVLVRSAPTLCIASSRGSAPPRSRTPRRWASLASHWARRSSRRSTAGSSRSLKSEESSAAARCEWTPELRDRTRSTRRCLVQIGRAPRSRADLGKQRMWQCYRRLMAIAQRVVGQAIRLWS